MNKFAPFLVVFLIILYALYNANFRDKQTPKSSTSESYTLHLKKHESTTHFEEELAKIETPEYIQEYIVKVINHGSDTLAFKSGVMEGGFASREDAPKIACYVMKLSGKQCAQSYPEDAAMFYTSICGGCHGDDGKGINGAFPDLTRKKMLGIAKREAFLKDQIKNHPPKSP